MHICPVCGGTFVASSVSASQIAKEFDYQREFVLSRLPASPSPEELKDLTDFMHGSPAPLASCVKCGLVRRDEDGSGDAASYEEDPNDPDVMAQVLPRYVQAFRQKEHTYRPLLRANAEVIEVGPHLGGFLQTAEEWNWRPIGLDVGIDTITFMRRNGLTVRPGTLSDSIIKPGRADAVFIWNCFEQLSDPLETLRAARQALHAHGLLVVRVPNLKFYRDFRKAAGSSRKALAYNNLLGFPYLYGYTLRTLNRLLARAGFKYERGFNSELVTTPFVDLSALVAREQSRISRKIARWSTRNSVETLVGPWIEVVYRRVSNPEPVCETPAIDHRFLHRAVA